MKRTCQVRLLVRAPALGLLCWLVVVNAAPVFAAVSALPAASPNAPQISLSVTSGAPGTQLVITGSGFPSSEIAAIYIDAPDPYLGQPGPLTDAQGRFTFTFATPGQDFDPSGRV